jgi:hypothetical protein
VSGKRASCRGGPISKLGFSRRDDPEFADRFDRPPRSGKAGTQDERIAGGKTARPIVMQLRDWMIAELNDGIVAVGRLYPTLGLGRQSWSKL